MTQAQAVATGLFNANVRHQHPCAYVAKLEWQGEPNGRDVQTDNTGTIVSMTVNLPNLSTAEGIHVGSTQAELTSTYAGKLSPGAHSPYGATYVLRDGSDYVNYFFRRDEHNRTSPTISAISLTRGVTDDFNEDGC